MLSRASSREFSKQVEDLLLTQQTPPWFELRFVAGCHGTKSVDGLRIYVMAYELGKETAEEMLRFVQNITKYLLDLEFWSPATHYMFPDFVKTKITYLRKWWKRGRFLQGTPESFLLQLLSEVAKEAKILITIYVDVVLGIARQNPKPAGVPPSVLCYSLQFWTKPHDVCPLCKMYTAVSGRKDKVYLGGALLCIKCAQNVYRCAFCAAERVILAPENFGSRDSKLYCVQCYSHYSTDSESALSALVMDGSCIN